MLLAGDIGGTKTELALFAPEGGPRAPHTRETFPSREYKNLEALVHRFLDKVHQPVTTACFAVAGPVIDGQAKTTNLPWVVDSNTLQREFRFDAVDLLNDLEAIAWSVTILTGEDVQTLNAGDAVSGGSIGVIAPGTGLGEGYLTWNGTHYEAHASEGGHADFAPVDEEQIGLLQHVLKRSEHVSYEHVCSGIGIPNIYDYLKERGDLTESPEVAEKLRGISDRTPIISAAATDASSPDHLSRATIEMFVSILGAEAGNLALKVLATGGIYLAGGIPHHIAPMLRGERFMRAFRSKGRFEELLTRVPVHVVVSHAALIGAARYGLDRVRR